MGLTLPTHLQVLQVPGPGEQVGAAVPVLQQERVFLESKGKGKVGSQREGWRGDPRETGGWPATEEGRLSSQRMVEAHPVQDRRLPTAGRGEVSPVCVCGEGGGGRQTCLQPR